MNPQEIIDLIIKALEDRKAQSISIIDVMGKTSVTDTLIIASGTSSRQVSSIAEYVVEQARKNHIEPIGVEGQQASEWVLVDLGDVIVHVMKKETREFYQLEKLWDTDESTEISRSV